MKSFYKIALLSLVLGMGMPMHQSVAAEKSGDVSGFWLLTLTFRCPDADCPPSLLPGTLTQQGDLVEFRNFAFGTIASGAVWNGRLVMEIDIDGYRATLVGAFRGNDRVFGFWRDMDGESGSFFGRRR